MQTRHEGDEAAADLRILVIQVDLAEQVDIDQRKEDPVGFLDNDVSTSGHSHQARD
jgi:hypothetical protein